MTLTVRVTLEGNDDLVQVYGRCYEKFE